jgi:hypothetical protein
MLYKNIKYLFLEILIIFKILLREFDFNLNNDLFIFFYQKIIFF